MKEEKYCINCKWMSEHPIKQFRYLCKRPGLGINMVTGEKITRDCESERAYFMIDDVLCCGQEGGFFEK